MSDSTAPGMREKVETTHHVDEQTAKKAAIAALVGTAMEWYDFFLFTTASALIFNVLYFDSSDPFLATMASFATMAVGFVARPIGGLIFGHLGDKIGRKTVLMITVVGIGTATGLIGLLPDRHAIGIAAPVLLIILRVFQGLAVGGEWGGAVTAAVESAPAHKRAWYAAFPQIGSPIGTILSSGFFFLVGIIITNDEHFNMWGWRIPFLLAIPLLLVSVYIRKHLEETPVFQELEEESAKESAPIIQVFKHSPLQVLIGFGANLTGGAGFFLVTTFVVSYGTQQLGMNKNLLLAATLVGAALEILVLVYGGKLGQKYGPARVSVIGGVLTILCAFPVFLMVDTTNPVLVILGVAFGVACLSVPYAANGALMTALFPPAHRLSGVAIAANLGSIVSGFTPMIATALLHASGEAWWPAPIMLIVFGAITLICSALAPKFSVKVEGYKY